MVRNDLDDFVKVVGNVVKGLKDKGVSMNDIKDKSSSFNKLKKFAKNLKEKNAKKISKFLEHDVFVNMISINPLNYSANIIFYDFDRTNSEGVGSEGDIHAFLPDVVLDDIEDNELDDICYRLLFRCKTKEGSIIGLIYKTLQSGKGYFEKKEELKNILNDKVDDLDYVVNKLLDLNVEHIFTELGFSMYVIEFRYYGIKYDDCFPKCKEVDEFIYDLSKKVNEKNV